MRERYSGVKTRFLRNDERLIQTKEDKVPFVIEPANESEEACNIHFLQSFLSSYSKEVIDDIATYGAVLLRGFHVKTTKEFEESILSIHGMHGMSHLFMSEPGRTHVDGLNYVFHTNSKIKTGGTFHLGGFHNENYYSTDVPTYISFCCFNPAKLGGETGMINMGRVYEKLDLSLQEQLEKNTFFVSKWPISIIANRYQINPLDVKKACVDFGLNIENENFVVMHKPSILKHPTTGKKILQANLCAELPGLNDAILKHFIHDYSGWKWIMHKAAWIFLGYQKLRTLSLILPEFFCHPVKFLKMRKQIRQRMKQYNSQSHLRISSVFKSNDIKTLAQLMHESYSSFIWKEGDILLIDNLQIAHAGMPGKTNKKFPRKIRAMLCNPFKILYSNSAPGLQNKDILLHETLGEIMHKMSVKKEI